MISMWTKVVQLEPELTKYAQRIGESKKVSSVKVDGGWFPVARINGTIKRREDTEKNERRVK